MTGPGFGSDEQRERFRRLAHTDRGPKWVEPTIPPHTGRPIHRWAQGLATLVGNLLRGVALILGVYLVAIYAGDHSQQLEGAWGAATVLVVVFLTGWPWWMQPEEET